MRNYKFAITSDGNYSHCGTDGTIPYDDVFNFENPPFNHKYVNNSWILNKNLLIDDIKSKIETELLVLSRKLAYNETYVGSLDYQEYKENILKRIQDNRHLLNSLQEKTLEELSVI